MDVNLKYISLKMSNALVIMSIAVRDYTERHKHFQRKNVQRFPRNINVHLIILLLILLLNLNSELNKNTPIASLADMIASPTQKFLLSYAMKTQENFVSCNFYSKNSLLNNFIDLDCRIGVHLSFCLQILN